MIYLHHYPASLFSEKIRLLLGYLNSTWHSVEISSIMPRPLLMPLSGGYRRTPVLQIGANVYCDTKIICKALARNVNDTTLYAPGFAAHRTADWADSQLFKVVVALNFRPEALGAMMGQFSEAEALAFAKDRAELTGDQPISTLSPDAALGYLEHTLAELESTLRQSGHFLLGDTPCIADFSIYHNLWFLNNNPVNAGLLTAHTGVEDWMGRMAKFGHGQVIDSDGAAALDAALTASPQLPELSIPPATTVALGTQVAVTPVDYGRVAVVGKLLACGDDEIVVQRHTEETGTIYTHFPRAGFDVQPA